MNISWDVFKYKNSDPRAAFENMCRLLFKYKYCDGTITLHSNPNHPGIEVDPVYSTKLSKKVSFQAKFFDTKTDYKQIKESVDTTIKYYSDKLDLLILYSNTDINTNKSLYQKIYQALKAVNIELELVTNQEVLDQVLGYPLVNNAFFGNCVLDYNWFKQHIQTSIKTLGDRHNPFNIQTTTNEFISIFLQDEEGVKAINNQKDELLNRLKSIIKSYPKYELFIKDLIKEIYLLEDLSTESIKDCLDWEEIIKEHLKDYYDSFNDRIQELESISSEDNDNKDKAHELGELRNLLSLFNGLSISKMEKGLIMNKVLLLTGNAGTGKTHLLSEKAINIINSNKIALLLTGQSFVSEDYITSQIPKSLNLHCSLEDLLSNLEAFGEENNCIVPIFIDAINESAYKEIWKQGLSNLFSIINEYNKIKIIISFRNGYENFLIDDGLKTDFGHSICKVNHFGFADNSFESISKYLDAYNIPFSPSYLLDRDFSNPLFLKLFCKTYDGSDVDINILFDKVIMNSNKEICSLLHIDSKNNYVKSLLNELCILLLPETKRQSVSYEELLGLNFWETFGLSHKKIEVINQLNKSGLLNDFARDDTIYYFLGYNLLEDYLIGKTIINMFPSKEGVNDYIITKVLNIENGSIKNNNYTGVFGVCANLYFEKYQEELIEPLLEMCNDQRTKNILCETYLEYYGFRNSKYTNFSFLLNFANKYRIDRNNIFELLFHNAFKANHPLNAFSLHKYLLDMPLTHRDYLWTTYINDYLMDENSRIFYLIKTLAQGENLISFNGSNVELVLILFSWLLTSSNIVLRDTASRALIEILKQHFYLCKSLLLMFENVNDPYVIQRLYAIVFGACTKMHEKHHSEYHELAIYVYNTIFDKDLVYPDILLREYAKLIIELYMHQYHDLEEINIEAIYPPYKSVPIPTITDSPYIKGQSGGIQSIQRSMTPDTHSGYYGDFGRYVFQSNLNNFENVDVENIYYYALQFIVEELGYTNELFEYYDQHSTRMLSRHDTIKIERIGKKYQRIAMFNILARISDTHYLSTPFEDKPPCPYSGAFEVLSTYFDPTINSSFLEDPYVLNIDLKPGITKVFFCNSEDLSDVENWLKEPCTLFSNHSSDLVTSDKYGNDWVYLYQNKKYENPQLKEAKSSFHFQFGDQIIWKMSRAYIVSLSVFEVLKQELENKNFYGRWFPEQRESYDLYNREIAWSSNFLKLYSHDDLDVIIDTGDFEEIDNEPILITDAEGKTLFEVDSLPNKKPIKKNLGNAKQTFLTYLYESQYDGSLNEPISIDYPCKDLIQYFNLKQKEFDGYLYDDETLVAFDGSLSGAGFGLLIRKDYLCKFLEDNDKTIFWTNIGEKQFFLGDMKQEYQTWSGFSYLHGGTIFGEMFPTAQNG